MLHKLRREAAPGVHVPVPRVRKVPDPVTDTSFSQRASHVPPDAYAHAPSADGLPQLMWPLEDQDQIRVCDPEDPELASTLRVVYAPGHAADHAMLWLEEDRILLTGDNVLGRGSTVFEDLIQYMYSLQRGLSLLDASKATPLGVTGTPMSGMSQENVLFPGHGPVIPKGKEALRRYLRHRVEREEQLIALFLCQPGDKGQVTNATAYPLRFIDQASATARTRQYTWTLRQFVSTLYENYSLRAYPAIARVLLLHLQKLSMRVSDLDKPPYALTEPINSTPRAMHAPLVQCMVRPSYQYTARPCPDLPRNDQEWREALDLPWQLVAL